MQRVELIEKSDLAEITADTDPFAGSGLDGEITWRYLKDGRNPRTGKRIRFDPAQEIARGRKARLRQMLPVLISMFLVMMAGSLMLRRNNFDYAAHGDREILKITTPYGDTITMDLHDLAYYVILVEREGDRRAKDYDADHPKKYWNLYMNDEGDDSGYISDLARRAVLDYALRDAIYAREAEKAGFEADPTLLSDVAYDADVFYRSMTTDELAISNYTDADVAELMQRETTAHEYMLYLCEQEEGSVLETIVTKYDVGGDYYQQLLERYEVSIDTQMWDKVRLGFVTINHD